MTMEYFGKFVSPTSDDAGLTGSNVQFYNYFANSLPQEVVAVHNPILDYSVDTLCECFRAIKLRKELRTAKNGRTSEDPLCLVNSAIQQAEGPLN